MEKFKKITDWIYKYTLEIVVVCGITMFFSIPIPAIIENLK